MTDRPDAFDLLLEFVNPVLWKVPVDGGWLYARWGKAQPDKAAMRFVAKNGTQFRVTVERVKE